MKIYLRTEKGWGLFDSEDETFPQEVKKRGIVIGNSAKIGDYAEIGDYANIGDSAKIGYSVEIGGSAEIGYSAKIGNYVEIGGSAKIGDSAEIGDYAYIGDSAKIGNYTKIGYSAKIGYSVEIGGSAEIGYSAKIGNYAKIGNSAKIQKFSKFTALDILTNVGIVMQEGEGVFYKKVTTKLKAFQDDTYQYVVGGRDKMNAKRNQDVECGEGWHFTNFWNAVAFKGEEPGVIISARIKLDDILSVHDKVRVKAYSDVKVVKIEGLGTGRRVKP